MLFIKNTIPLMINNKIENKSNQGDGSQNQGDGSHGLRFRDNCSAYYG
jgi:hypothetical protein